MEKAEIQARLAKIKCFLLDLDGTFYLGDRLLPGSLDFLEKLRETGRDVLFVTNNSSKSAEAYVRKLENLGVPEVFRKVLTSGQAAGSYALREMPGKRAFLLGTPMLRRELAAMGVALDDRAPDYVLIGYDTTLTYDKMVRVCDYVRAGLPYIATHPDFNCPTEHGFAPDIGAMITFIEASTGRKPDVILGKPYEGIVQEALQRTCVPKEALAMVGDRLYTDIATGVNFGILSILVLTGETRPEDLRTAQIQPDLVLERLCEMNEYL